MQRVTPLRLNVIYLVYFTLIMPHILHTHTQTGEGNEAVKRGRGVREGDGDECGAFM